MAEVRARKEAQKQRERDEDMRLEMKFRTEQEQLQEEHKAQMLKEGKKTPEPTKKPPVKVPPIQTTSEQPPKFVTQKERNIWHAKQARKLA